MLSHKVMLNIQAVLVIAGAIAAWIFVPEHILLPLAWATVAIAAGACFGIRAYMRKLHSESRLRGEDQLFYTEVAMAFAIPGIAAFIVLIVEYS